MLRLDDPPPGLRPGDRVTVSVDARSLTRQSAVLFVPVALRYHERTYLQDEAPAASPVPAG